MPLLDPEPYVLLDPAAERAYADFAASPTVTSAVWDIVAAADVNCFGTVVCDVVKKRLCGCVNNHFGLLRTRGWIAEVCRKPQALPQPERLS